MKTKRDALVDAVFFTVLLAVLIVLAVSAAGTKVANTVDQVGTEAVTEPEQTVCTEEATMPEETVAATEEVTVPDNAVYDVPLDVSLQQHIVRQAELHGIAPEIVVAMAYKESTYDHAVVGDGGNSYGLLQVQPKWHYQRMLKLGCTDLLDPYQNVTVAVDYLGELLDRYGSIDKALTAYNRGSYNGTVNAYAKTVMAYAEKLRK